MIEVIEPDSAANNAEVNQRLIAATEIATANTTEVTATQADESVSNAEASAPTEAPPVTDPVEQEVAEQAPEPMSPPAETSTETPAVATAPPVAEPAPIEAPAAPVARVVDPVAEKIRAANPGSQFVQHIVLASAARAEEWLGTQSGLDRAVVVAVSINSSVSVTITRRLSTDERARFTTPFRSSRFSIVVTVARLRLTALAMSDTVGSLSLPMA